MDGFYPYEVMAVSRSNDDGTIVLCCSCPVLYDEDGDRGGLNKHALLLADVGVCARMEDDDRIMCFRFWRGCRSFRSEILDHRS